MKNIKEEAKIALEGHSKFPKKNNNNMKRMQSRRRKLDKKRWKVCQKLEKGSLMTMKYQKKRRKISAQKP